MQSRIHRRRFLLCGASAASAGALLGMTGISGCRDPSADQQETQNAAPTVSTVPLRVAIVSDADQAEAADLLRGGWQSVSEQPVKTRTVDLQTYHSSDQAGIKDIGRTSDVVLFPVAASAGMIDSNAILPISARLSADSAYDIQSLLSPLQRILTDLGSESFCVPAGCIQPIVAARGRAVVAENDAPLRWSDWTLIAQQGGAAEPLAGDWSAYMFLHRASTHVESRWLFDRDELRSVIAEAPYVAALQEMAAAAQHYAADARALTPRQAWRRIQTGELDAALAWPIGFIESQRKEGVELGPTPVADQRQQSGDDEVRRFADGTNMMAAMSVGCRQSDAAIQFIRWVTGNYSMSDMRQGLEGFSISRNESMVSAAGDVDPMLRDYERLLRGTLGSGRLRIPLRLRQANRYVSVLADAVRSAIDGADPESVLKDCAGKWDALTEEIGLPDQQSVWRRSQGLSR